MEFVHLKKPFSICRLTKIVPQKDTPDNWFLSKTDEECSLVCPTDSVPKQGVEKREDNWRGFRVQGPLDFSMIGVLSEVAGVLARAEIGIFVISTYDTDYIFVKEENIHRAVDALCKAGHCFVDMK